MVDAITPTLDDGHCPGGRWASVSGSGSHPATPTICFTPRHPATQQEE